MGLGVLGNPPANPYQPPLTNGIHLRWGFLRELGFPWYGFYLFRRPAQAGRPLCLSSVSGGLKKGVWPDKKHYTAIGVLSSNLNLVLTDDFSPSGQVEFALSDRDYLRFDLPAGELARRIELRIGFPPSGGAESKVTVFSGAVPIRVFNVEGQAGQVVSTLIEGDAISAVRIDSDTGSLVDLCYVPVTQDATQGWQRLPKFSYPMGLPVSQPDYPCTVANPQALLTDRVHYQLPPAWDAAGPGTTFTELRDQLVKLVQGGPGAAPMVDRIFAAPAGVSNPPDPDPPTLNTFYILDMVLLGALHPALAQLVGLYWVDQSAVVIGGVPGLPFDYLIVADHTGVGERNADKVLSIINTSGFAQLDGYIVFNKRAVAAPPLPAPVDLQAFALPGGTFPDADGHLPPANNNAGLRWKVGWDDSDGLLPESAVMYLIWRANLGDAATPAPAGTYILITKDPPDKPKPIMVTEARIPNGLVPQQPPDWPAVPFFIDRNLGDGWYGYEVSGIDLFGRYSPNSAPSQLLLRDKIPPPMPTAIEAYALDPEDPFLQRDEAYSNWFTSLNSSVQQTLIGLRVRWIWTLAHQQQAPDTLEFRIYFHPDSDLETAHDLAQNWPERFHVVAYNEFFSSINPTSQNFLAIGGINSVSITAASGAKWWAVSSDPWIGITSGLSGSGDGTVTYFVASNPGTPRTGTLKIAGHTFIINQQEASSAPPISPAAGASEDRVYEVFLPLASATNPVGLSLNPSLANPIVYAHIGVSAADDKPHTNDQRTTGNWSNRPGNEGRVGPPARIYRVWRGKPGPPAALADTERVFASPADYHDRSFYTYRWQPPNQADNLKLHLFRAMDDAIIKADWFIRTTRIALDPGNPQHLRFFPKAWSQNVGRQQAAANALNAINSPAAYNSLSNDALELLACLPGNDGVEDLNELKQRDWAIRQSRHNLSAGDLTNFSWDQTKRQTIAAELNGFVLSGAAATAADNKITLDGTADLSRVRPERDTILLISDTKNPNREYRITAVDINARTLTLGDAPMLTGGASAWAIPLYQTLSDNGWRALAILPGNDAAFIQVTINPLDSFESDPADSTKLRWRDRRGPDNADDFPLDPNARRAYIDTLDGRSTNRYFYRAAFVDGAHNLGELGLVGPVVYLRNVVPPRAPVITKVLGGDRQITIKWASNREADIAEYRVYRAVTEERARDIRLMELVHTESVAGIDPMARPAEISWSDTPVSGLVRSYYRLCAIDDADNRSGPSQIMVGQAYDYGPPIEPNWERSEWIKLDFSDHEHPWQETAGTLVPAVALVFTTSQENITVLLERRDGSWKSITQWLRASVYDENDKVWRFTVYDRTANPTTDQRYRIRLITNAGMSLVSATERAVPAP